MKRPAYKRAAVPSGEVMLKCSDTLWRSLLSGRAAKSIPDAFLDDRFGRDAEHSFSVKGGDFINTAAVAEFYCVEEPSMLLTDAETGKLVMGGSLVIGRRYLVAGDLSDTLLAKALGRSAAADNDGGQAIEDVLAKLIPKTNKILFAYDPVVLGHVPPHDRTPEGPQRVGRSVDLLKNHPIFGYFTGLNDAKRCSSSVDDDATQAATSTMSSYFASLRVPTRYAEPAEIYAVHDALSYAAFIEKGMSLTAHGPLADAGHMPTDVYCNDRREEEQTAAAAASSSSSAPSSANMTNPSQKAVLASCGLAIDTLKRVVLGGDDKKDKEGTTEGREDVDGAFCLIRPPGHHCGCKTPNGFCLVNNVVVAIKALHKKDPTLKIAIVDCDVHHGEGTQSLVEGDARILFFSTHRCDEGCFFPYGTGRHTNYGGGNCGGALLQQPQRNVSVAVSAVLNNNNSIAASSAGGMIQNALDTRNARSVVPNNGFGCCTSLSSVDVAEDNRSVTSSSSEVQLPRRVTELVTVAPKNDCPQQCINVPFDTAGHIADKCHQVISDVAFAAACDAILVPALKKFQPDVVIISCGFDSLFGDPLGRMAVTPNGYSNLIRKIQNLGLGRRTSKTGKEEGRDGKEAAQRDHHHHHQSPTRIVAVLEGGYNSEAVSHGVAAVYGTMLLNRNELGRDDGDGDDCLLKKSLAETNPIENDSGAVPFNHSSVASSSSSFSDCVLPQTWAVLRTKQERALRDYRRVVAEMTDAERSDLAKQQQQLAQDEEGEEGPARDKPASAAVDAMKKKVLLEPLPVADDDTLKRRHLEWVEAMVSRVRDAHPLLKN